MVNTLAKFKGMSYAFIAAFCFGLGSPFIKIAADNIPVFFYQVFVSSASVILLGVVWLFAQNKQSWHIKKLWKEYLFIGIISSFIPGTLVTIGYDIGFSANASVLLRAEVFAVLIISWIFFKQKTNRRQLLGIIFGFIGAIIFASNGSLGFAIGDLLILAGAFFYGTQFWIVKQVQQHISMIQLNIVRLLVALPLFGSASLLFEELTIANYLPYLPHAFIGNSLLIFTIGATLYLAAVKHWEVWKVAFTAQFGAVFIGAVSSMLILGERFSEIQWLGTGIIVVSMFVVLFERKRRGLRRLIR